LGHSYGGNTVLFLAAMDQRIAFSCSSGAACTYAHKMRSGTGIEMAEVIPDIAKRFDIAEVIKCIAPRPILIVSASDDQYSKDADVIVDRAKEAFATFGVERVSNTIDILVATRCRLTGFPKSWSGSQAWPKNLQSPQAP